MARAVTSYVASLFGSEELADCVVIFCQAQSDVAKAPPAKRRKKAGAGQQNGPAPPIGDPLPAHRLTLFGGSARLRSQAERWTLEQTAGGSKPELRVPLGSPEDLPHALSALRFLYTGKVDGSSAAQLLQVRRQAAYLLVEGCVEACDTALLDRIAGDLVPQQAGGTARSSGSSPLAPVAELFACRHLLPDAAESGGDTATEVVMRLCRVQLVLHSRAIAASQGTANASGDLGDLLAWAFGDVPSLLCNPGARAQMLRLPVAAMEALLGSDSFATDDEAMVLLVLAQWREANKAPFASACDRLCRLVRLSQLTEDYLHDTLPHIPWFPLSAAEHAFLRQHVSSAGQAKKRQALEAAAAGLYDTTSPWYAAGARPCGRSDLNRRYDWYVDQEDLEKGLAAPQAAIRLTGRFDTGDKRLVSRGLEWFPSIRAKATDEMAGVFIHALAPAALCLPESVERIRLASTSVRVVVCRWAGEGDGSWVEAYSKKYLREEYCTEVGGGLGVPSALPLAKALAAGAPGGDGVSQLRRWSEYLHDDTLLGSLTFV